MKRLFWFILCGILAVSLMACAAQEKRKDELRARFPNLSEEKIDAISLGVVEVGMTKDQALAALNNVPPYYRNIEGDKWSYVEYVLTGETGQQEVGKTLYFQDGKVVKITNFLREGENLPIMQW